MAAVWADMGGRHFAVAARFIFGSSNMIEVLSVQDFDVTVDALVDGSAG